MPSVEERLAYLEGRVHEHGTTLGEMSTAITGMRSEMATMAADLRSAMAGMAADLRGEMRTMRTELRGEISATRTELCGEISDLRKEMIAGFRWLVGLQALVVVAIVTALAAEFFQ